MAGWHHRASGMPVADVLCAAVLARAAFAPGGPAPRVPAEYADLYALLDAKLSGIEGVVTARGGDPRHDVVFGAELLPANANRGEALFPAQTWPVVLLNLDSLQQLGVRGVKVAITYPVLVPAFPRSAGYLAFYRRLGDRAGGHARCLAALQAPGGLGRRLLGTVLHHRQPGGSDPGGNRPGARNPGRGGRPEVPGRRGRGRDRPAQGAAAAVRL